VPFVGDKTQSKLNFSESIRVIKIPVLDLVPTSKVCSPPSNEMVKVSPFTIKIKGISVNAVLRLPSHL